MGFYTLLQSSIDLDSLTGKLASRLPRFPTVPVTLLGRLAVALSSQKQGLGEFLLMDALRRSAQVAEQVASFAVVVDAKDEQAQKFYQHMGFLPMVHSPNRLMLPMRTITDLFK